MKKLIIIAIALATIAAGGAFAQRNTVSVGAGAGVGIPLIANTEIFASYEFEIIPELSIGASAAIQFYPMATWAVAFAPNVVKDVFGPVFEGQVRYYPFAESFHIDLAFGYSNFLSSMDTFLIAPGVGWRFDIGEPGGFVMNLGLRVEIYKPIGDNIFANSDEENGADLTPFNILAGRLGFGYRF